MAGVYVHVPFCASKCAYCAFYSAPGGAALHERWADGVLSEWRRRRAELDGPVETVYIGGGTPSVLPAGVLGRVIAAMLPPSGLRELTVEANPEDVNADMARRLAALSPVVRVSMGVQSMVDAELRAVGRRHTAARVPQAVEALRRAGISNISLDLIYGLPGQTRCSWLDSLRAVLELRPPHLSAYALSVEEGTPLHRAVAAGRLAVAPDDVQADMYADLCALAARAGYDHYEISNFALPGRRALHNASYWDGHTHYLGLGPTASSLTRLGRLTNTPAAWPPTPGACPAAPAAPGPSPSLSGPSEFSAFSGCSDSLPWRTVAEPETALERVNDYVMVRLRTREGLDPRRLAELHGPEAARAVARLAERPVADGLLTRDPDGTLRFTEPQWLRSDAALAALMLLP